MHGAFPPWATDPRPLYFLDNMNHNNHDNKALALVRNGLVAARRLPLIPETIRRGAQTRIFHCGEIAVISMVYFWVVWQVAADVPSQGLGLFPILVILMAVFYVLYISPVLIHHDSLAARGLGPAPGFLFKKDNFIPALQNFGAWTIVGIAGLLLAGYLLHPSSAFRLNGYSLAIRFILYLLSALAQDALFFGFFLRRWQAVFGYATAAAPVFRKNNVIGQAAARGLDRVGMLAVVANALLFSLYHLPNPPLMILTLIMGLVWGRVFAQFPNLAVAALGHALMGTILHLVVKVNIIVGSLYYSGYKSFYRLVFPFMEPLINGGF